jgi:hypothetical protein
LGGRPRRLALGKREPAGVETAQRVASAHGTHPSDVEPGASHVDAVRRRPLARAVGRRDHEARDDEVVLVDERLELRLALTHTSEDG